VLDATYEVGLSGPSRLYNLFVTYEAMTPGEYKRQGADLKIRYGVCPTPFGKALVLSTERGVAGLTFVDGDAGEALERAREEWPKSAFVADAKASERAIAQATLLIVEGVYPPRIDQSEESRGAVANDVNMLVCTGGRQRSEAEFRGLFDAAGFRLMRIVPTQGPVKVIEGVCA
jgi:hypothetical protein